MSARADRVPAFHAMAMSRLATERAAAGQQIWHLEVGQPSTGAPAAARAAAAAALSDPTGTLGYTEAAGLRSLRVALSKRYAAEYGVTVDPEQILIVAGASAGFTLAFLAAFDRGAPVGVLEPGYPCYRNTLWALDMEPVMIPVGQETRWVPTVEVLTDALERTRRAGRALEGLVIASPSNPTGTVLTAGELDVVIEFCRAHQIRLIVDEIYHGIIYPAGASPAGGSPTGGAPAVPTAAGRDDSLILINSFSKYFSMTGWRVGWMVVPTDLRAAVERLQQNLYICAPHISQVAARAALGPDCHEELEGHLARYATNREILRTGLHAAGILLGDTPVTDAGAADGAFYIYADVQHLLASPTGSEAQPDQPHDRPVDSFALCLHWLDTLGVAATPGVDFDLVRGSHHVRFSYAGPTADIAAAAELLTH